MQRGGLTGLLSEFTTQNSGIGDPASTDRLDCRVAEHAGTPVVLLSANYSGEVMELHERVARVQSKADLIRLIEALARDLRTKPDGWENDTLDRYLSALAGWLEDSDGYFQNQSRPIPLNPTWEELLRC